MIHYTEIRRIVSPPIPSIDRILIHLNTLAFAKYKCNNDALHFNTSRADIYWVGSEVSQSSMGGH